MSTTSVQKLYEKYYVGEKARQGIFDALAAWCQPKKTLYPGSFIHVTASFVFPSVVYVDIDSKAKHFFSKMEDVLALITRHKVYGETPEVVFHGSSYETDIPEPSNTFDLLISLYGGFISKPCKHYLKIGGILAVNNSHGDAGLASVDSDYKFIGVIRGYGDRFHVSEKNLDTYFRPKKKIEITEELLRKQNRGVAYTKVAPVYLFKKV